MSYDEAKARVFKLLIPAVGTVFSCPAYHHGHSYLAVWQVQTHLNGPAFNAFRAVPAEGNNTLIWPLNDYWLALNVGRARFDVVKLWL